jgi:NADH:ubiquinone oxidoreductase subunit 5 (subunit L)/multisubunit Na+/H+ antiporter MnhA subunit
MVNHTIYKSCLFLSGGNVEKKTGTADMSKLGGLARYMPITFACFLVASLSISGIPPLNGFVSKWMVYQAIVELGAAKDPAWVIWLIAAMFGSAITVANSMRLIHTIFLGRQDPSLSGIKEAGVTMLAPVLILASICITFGICAFTIPIPLLIAPVFGDDPIGYTGIWEPGIATGLILAGILIGLIMYFLIAPKKARSVGIFIGGEDPGRLDRVSGAEFYDTIRHTGPLGRLYDGEDKGSFDVYVIAKRIVGRITWFFQKLHNGILPTYLVWCLLGMVAMFIALFVFVR